MEKQKYQISVKEILKVTNGQLITGSREEIFENFTRDTREIQEKDMYIGIKSEKKNGAIYFEEAFEKGAKGVILQDYEITEKQKEKYSDKCIIIVTDTIKAMQEIAKLKMEKYNIPVVAITGSVRENKHKRHCCKCNE